MNEIEFLDLEDLLIFVRMLGAGPVRDAGLLESAAALLHSICKNQALVDGNERLALLSTITFLRVNDSRVTMSQDEAFDLVMAIAEGRLDVPGIAEALGGDPSA